MDQIEKSNLHRLGARADQADRLLSCVAAEDTVRIILIDGKRLVMEARRLHGLSRVATAALGRQLMMTAIMAGELKHEDDVVSTILRGDGPAGSMICTGNARLEVKGSISDGKTELPPTPDGKLDVGGFVGRSGKLSVVRDLGLGEPYVGVSNLVSGEIAMDFAEYYAASQQQPALVYLGVRVDAFSGEVLSAGGVLAEPLPGCSAEALDALQALSDQISALSERLDAGETLVSFALRVFGGLGCRVVSEREARYLCDCTRERVERALLATGADELADMIARDRGAEVTCQFCERAYAFSEEELRRLFASAAARGEAHEA